MRIALLVGCFMIAVAIDQSIFDDKSFGIIIGLVVFYCCMLDVLHYFKKDRK